MPVLPHCQFSFFFFTVGTQLVLSVRNQWSSWCPGDSGKWWSSSSCPRSRVVIIWNWLAEPLITLQGEERVCECSEVTQRRHHLTLCEGMTIDSMPCWNLVHKQRIMAVYNFCIWASGRLHLECGWKFSFIYNVSKHWATLAIRAERVKFLCATWKLDIRRWELIETWFVTPKLVWEKASMLQKAPSPRCTDTKNRF